MDFELSDEQRVIQSTARDFAEREFRPHAAAIQLRPPFDRVAAHEFEVLREAGIERSLAHEVRPPGHGRQEKRTHQRFRPGGKREGRFEVDFVAVHDRGNAPAIRPALQARMGDFQVRLPKVFSSLAPRFRA